MRLANLSIIFTLLSAIVAFAENAIVLDGATIIHGNGEITTNGCVVISGQEIRYAGPKVGRPSVDAAEIIDLSSYFILPGLIDSDVHLDGYPYIDQWVSSGITTIADVGASLETSQMYKNKTVYFRGILSNVSNRWNRRYGPDVLISGKMITVPRGFPFGYIGFDIATPVSGVEEARGATQDLINAGVDFLRIIIDERLGRNLKHPTLTDAEVQAIVKLAHENELRVMAHVDTVNDVRKAVSANADVLLHTCNDILPTDLVEEIVKKSIPIIPSVELTDSFIDYLPLSTAKAYQQAVVSNLQTLVEAGAELIYGSDFPNGQFGLSKRELDAFVNAGLSPHEVIQSLTSRPAAFWNLQDRGIVTEGRLADLIVVKGNPLVNVRDLLSPQYVMKRGRFVRRPPLEIEAAFAHYQFSEIAADPEWNIEDKIHYRNTRFRVSPYFGFSSLNHHFTMGGYFKALFPESIFHPSLQIVSGVNFPDRVFSGEVALNNRFDINNEISLKAGLLGSDSFFSSLSSRHKLGAISFWPEINFRKTQDGIEWLRTETALDMGLQTNFFYQDLYPYLFRRGVVTWEVLGGYNVTLENPFAATLIENHTVLGFGRNEILFDIAAGLSSPQAPLNRMMNLRETASFDNETIVGGLKLFGGLGYQLRLFRLMAGMFDLKLGAMAQMGFLHPTLQPPDLWSSDFFFGEAILFSAFQLFYVFEVRVGAALDFEAWRPFDISQTALCLSILLLYSF